MSQSILEVKNLTKLYKNGRGVKDISFTLNSGEVMGLLGPNGSGKTTTMKAIVGIVNYSMGNIHICGTDVSGNHEAAMAHVGALIESPALYGTMTAKQNLKLVARFYDDVDDRRIDEVLNMVSMQAYANDKVRSFSLGMRQRIGLAGAFISRPKLLILDEPANGLDIEGMLYVRNIIKSASENGAAVLISSHLASEIQSVATKAAVIHSGSLLGLLSMEEILEKHGSTEEFFLSFVRRDVYDSV